MPQRSSIGHSVDWSISTFSANVTIRTGNSRTAVGGILSRR
ncbi:hypothetical protein ACFFX0_05430 [Citricoccus parietis]|uniref:Uncharacterized protein n=1 Tax=Citricoccus parietis TaxID=592307 RepID=A0ABV5FVG5_9MICC